MVLIRCTEKLRKSLGLTYADEEVLISDNPLEEWYAHVFLFDRKKHVIATNARTLYSAVVHQVSKRDKDPLASRIAKAVGEAMYYCDYTEAEIRRVTALFEKAVYARTSGRRVTGSMNELLIHYTAYLAECPSMKQPAAPKVIP